uniref:Uncharacterized protein n=1 Tax=Naja naja TaxID=35670 RepID=A0A8C6YD69_NAJNA
PCKSLLELILANDELPVHLKKGTSDVVMYRATMALATLGEAAFPLLSQATVR